MQSCWAAAQDEYKDVPEGVIAADFYHSNELMALSDEAIVQKVHDTLKICEPGFRDAKASVFSPGPA